MSNETFMAYVLSRLREAVRDAGHVLVTVSSNVRYGEERNKRKKISLRIQPPLIRSRYYVQNAKTDVCDSPPEIPY